MLHDTSNYFTTAYFDTQVATATPQKLRLMLIEGAIRFARGTQSAWQQGDADSGLESLIRCRDIIGELIAGIQAESSPLAKQVLGIYLYLFTTLTQAQLTHDQNQLAAVIRVLEEERETWQTICEQLPDRVCSSDSPVEETEANVAPLATPFSEPLCLDA
jgi:flagellar protein FliS